LLIWKKIAKIGKNLNSNIVALHRKNRGLPNQQTSEFWNHHISGLANNYLEVPHAPSPSILSEDSEKIS
jgi:hypothetical protein